MSITFTNLTVVCTIGPAGANTRAPAGFSRQCSQTERYPSEKTAC